jgi:hypothetical protein
MLLGDGIHADHLSTSLKQHCAVTEQINVWMRIKVCDLSLKPVRVQDVISIHPRNIFSACNIDTFVESGG